MKHDAIPAGMSFTGLGQASGFRVVYGSDDYTGQPFFSRNRKADRPDTEYDQQLCKGRIDGQTLGKEIQPGSDCPATHDYSVKADYTDGPDENATSSGKRYGNQRPVYVFPSMPGTGYCEVPG